MSESIKQRTNSMANHRDADAMRKVLSSVLTDLQTLRAANCGLLFGSATYNPPSLLDAGGVTTNVVVTGAVLGDIVAAVSFSLSLQGITISAYVSAADTVSVRFQNESGGTLDLASGTLRVVVLPYQSMVAGEGMLRGSAVYDTASLADGAGATATVTVPGAALNDFAMGSFGVDLQGITTTYYVSATGVVSARIQNESGGTIDLASTTIRVRVLPNTLFGTVQAFAALPGHLTGTATYDASSLVDAAGETTTVTVTGAALGDLAIVALNVDLAGMLFTPYVSAADTVSVRLQNETAGTLNLASVNLTARVFPAGVFTTAAALNTLA